MVNKLNQIIAPKIDQQNQGVKEQKSNLDSNREEFLNILKNKIETEKQHGVKFSGHAQKRLVERNLTVDGDEYLKLRSAIDTLKSKGGKDSLVITSKAAYIVDVDKETVVTAIEKDNMAENVFTKIDSTLFLN